MFSLFVLSVLILGILWGTKSAFGGALLLSGYGWFSKEIPVSGIFLLNTIPLITHFIRQMRLNYQKESGVCIQQAQKNYLTLEDQNTKILSDVELLEKRYSGLGNIYEITRHLGRALDLKDLFQYLGETLYRTIQVSSCWFIHLKSTEENSVLTYKVERLGDQRIKVVLEPTGLFEEERRDCLKKKETIIRMNERTIFPLWGENSLKGILVVESISSYYHEESLSIIVGQLALNLEKVELYNRVQELAILDGLTGVYVRRHFLERLQEEFNRSRGHRLPLSVLMCDLDYFKEKNDRYGHLVGDEVLKAVSKILKANTREVDLVGRYGGEEFSVALPETSSHSGWQAAERIRLAVEESELRTYDEKIRITISIGVVSLTDQTESLEMLIDQADHALYLAKTKGRNRVEVFVQANG